MQYKPSTRTLWLACVMLLASGSGCGLLPVRPKQGPLPPRAFVSSTPPLDDVVYAINANTRRVRQLQTKSAGLSIEGLTTSLRADLALERPNKFRLRAELFQFTGRELDVGSNDEQFWMWVRRNPEPAVFYANHARFAASSAGQILSVDPMWLVEALGLPELDPAGHHEGPTPAGVERFEIRSTIPTEHGPRTRVMIVDENYGFVLEQHLYDAQGQVLAAVKASDHRFYPDHGVSLPHELEVALSPQQPTRLSFQLTINDYLVNQLYGEPEQLWARPVIEGSPPVDIADPRFQPQRIAPAPNLQPDGRQWSLQTAEQPGISRYRGFH